jgi:hypothetical protein
LLVLKALRFDNFFLEPTKYFYLFIISKFHWISVWKLISWILIDQELSNPDNWTFKKFLYVNKYVFPKNGIFTGPHLNRSTRNPQFSQWKFLTCALNAKMFTKDSLIFNGRENSYILFINKYILCSLNIIFYLFLLNMKH